MTKAKRNASLVEVAALAQVSIQTVSNVINSPHVVKSLTKEKVLKAIDFLDYTPNLSARRLRSKKSSSIAVRLDPNFTEGSNLMGLAPGFIQDEFVYYLVEAANQRGIKVVVYTVGQEASELSILKTFMQSQDVDGIILTSTVENDERLNLLQSWSAPFLTFGRPWGASDMYSTANPWIDIDGHAGIAAATEMFWKKGAKSIGFVGWGSQKPEAGAPRSTGEDRYLGWFERFGELRGNRIIEDKFATFGSESVEGGRRAAHELLDHSKELEAVVCVSDTLALGCFLEFQKLGYHEIEVSGFDNSPISKEFGFSSLDQNLSKVAQGALGILMGDTGNQIKKINYNEEQTAAHLLLAPNLIVR